MVLRIPATGTDKESLHSSLQRHRQVALWKVEGLDDEQLRRVVVPSGLSILGVIKHLAWVQYGWIRGTFGYSVPPWEFDPADPDREFRIEPQETTADVIAFFDESCAMSDEVIDDLDVDALGTSWTGETVTLRWTVLHMVEEFARHDGHLDILREMVDGRTGYFPEG